MGPYAENTSVPIDRSKGELERILEKYNATGFMSGWKATPNGGQLHVIAFEMHGRRIQFRLEMPSRNEDRFRLTPSGEWLRTDKAWQEAYEKEVRRRWRALVLVVKA